MQTKYQKLNEKVHVHTCIHSCVLEKKPVFHLALLNTLNIRQSSLLTGCTTYMYTHVYDFEPTAATLMIGCTVVALDPCCLQYSQVLYLTSVVPPAATDPS